MTSQTRNEKARELGALNKESNIVQRTTIAERIRSYSEAFVNGNNKRDSYAAAGYSCPTFTNAANFHERYHKEIDKEISKHIHNKVPKALQVLEEIMVHGRSETARVKAALEIMDRAGFDKQTRISVDHQEPKSMDDLQKELRSLLNTNPDVLLLEGSEDVS